MPKFNLQYFNSSKRFKRYNHWMSNISINFILLNITLNELVYLVNNT